ncbi:ClpP family protease [Serinicoccus kebangsaanensis]|uniref:ClpP family protease n=1 Tax=Serinicoccus kebangsaanensis TaxID=2602069 RepID=UPI00124C619F|nr:ATP-dependent Clp protease proteolytic subunit [Serinicoccus kebangsaanensis]
MSTQTAPPPPGRDLDEDLYRQLFEQRTLLLGEPLEEWNSNRLCSGLLILAAQDATADIRLLINSPGGSVPGMLAIRDCMRLVGCDVVTVNLGMAYSAGQFLLSSGTPGKRYALPHSKVMLHQGSAGIGGTAMDIEIQADDLRHTRDTVLTLVAADTGQDLATVEHDSRRDRWFDAEAARDYGFVDHVVASMSEVMPVRRPQVGLGGGR